MSRAYEPEKALKHLRRISVSLKRGTDEYLSVDVAAKALLFIHATRRQEEFTKYLADFKKKVTPEENRFLSSIGLEAE